MNLINERWKRLLIALFLGGLLSEGLRSWSDQKVKINALLFAVLLYFVLTNTYKKSLRKIDKEQQTEK